MASVTHNFTVGQTVFHVSANDGVQQAVVSTISIKIAQSGTVINYTIAYSKPANGSAVVLEDSLYNDVDLALAAYKPTVVV
ncbi:MAG: hypothetical protein ACXW2E_01875 [Nitrososphaeraceae archaeon]